MTKTKKRTTKKRTVKRKVVKRRSSKRKSSVKKKVVKHEKIEKEPEYMVQVNDPTMLRKDLLESLREVIIFMQGYETFRKIQEEKVNLISVLKTQVKDLNSLVDTKLRKYLPKGKLRLIKKPSPVREEFEADDADTLPNEEELGLEVVKIDRGPKVDVPPPEVASAEPVAEPRVMVPPPERERPKSELEELEDQLKDIENQLQDIQ